MPLPNTPWLFVVITKEALLSLYLSLVRPIHEYAIQAVLPYLQKDIDLTERLQKLVPRLVKCLWHFSFERRLDILGLSSLVHLRLHADLVLVYNILHGRVNLPIEEFVEIPANPQLGGHRFKLRRQLPQLSSRKLAFPARIAEPWGKLPPEVFRAASEEIFKHHLAGFRDTLFVKIFTTAFAVSVFIPK